MPMVLSEYDSVVSAQQKSVTLMGPSPVMWAPTSRTRQSKSLWQGSKLDKSEESRLFLLRSPPSAAVPETLIPPWPERFAVKDLINSISSKLFPPPFFYSFYFLYVSGGCVEINPLKLLIDMWWLCEMIIFDKHFNRSRNDHGDTITYQNEWFCGGRSSTGLNGTLYHTYSDLRQTGEWKHSAGGM